MAATTPDLQAHERMIHEMSDAIWGADGSPAAIDDYFAKDFVDHEPDQTIKGRKAYKEFETALRNGFPDLAGEVEQVVCQDDLVAVRYSASGTHTGDLWGIEPTGKHGSISGQVIYRLENGKIVEAWHQFDRLGMFQQLSLLPEDLAA